MQQCVGRVIALTMLKEGSECGYIFRTHPPRPPLVQWVCGIRTRTQTRRTGRSNRMANTRSVGSIQRDRPTERTSRGIERTQTHSNPQSTWPPTRNDHEGWQQWINQSGPQPAIRRSTNGRPPGLADELYLGGNGLVPRVATEALAKLALRLGIGRIKEK